GDHSQLYNPQQRGGELQFARAQRRPDPTHHGGHRLRDTLAASRGDAAHGGGAHSWTHEGSLPFVRQQALGDFAVTYEINVYCDNAQAMGMIYTALHRNILDIFNEYGVQIMTPAYEGDPEKPKVVPKEEWFSAPAKSTDSPAKDGHKP